MRVIFVGASRLTMHTARLLLKSGHDVVIIERDPERIENLRSELGCGVIHGDGSKPAILREADPLNSDYLFCFTDNDQTNIIASLLGRSLGFKHVVTHIDDPDMWSHTLMIRNSNISAWSLVWKTRLFPAVPSAVIWLAWCRGKHCFRSRP